jgi:multiple sugar transport system substrate-binding protein
MLRSRGRSIAGTALVVALLGACSSGPPAAARQDPNGQLEIWIRQQPGSDSARTADALAHAFTASTGVPTKVVAIFDDFETKLQQQGAQHDLPDIVINDTAQLGNMQTQGWLTEIDRGAFPGTADIADRAWTAARGSDGHFYGVPFSAQAVAIIARADWRRKLGLPVPRTWADLAALGQAFTRDDPDGNGKADTYGFTIPATTKRGYTSWYASALIWANGGDFLTKAGDNQWRPAVNSPKTVAAVSWLQQQFCANKSVVPGAVNNDTTVSHDLFEKGAAGIYLVGPYVLARFVNNIGSDKVEVIPVPKGPDGGPGTLAEGENVYLMAGSHNTDGQRRFARFATSPAGQKVGMNGDKAGAIVRLPVNTTIDIGTVRQDQRWKVYADQYRADGVYTPSVPNWAPFRQTSADAMNAVLAGCGASVQDAMDRLAGTFTEELRKQNVLAGG